MGRTSSSASPAVVRVLDAAIDRTRPSLSDLARGKSTAALRRQLGDELTDYRRLFGTLRKDAEEKAQPRLEQVLFELDGWTTLYWDFVRLSKAMDANGVPSLAWERGSGGDPSFILEILLLSQMNLLVAIRSMLVAGQVGPGRILVRAYMETADLLLAVAVHEDTFRAYQTWVQEPGREGAKHWKRALAPSSIMRVLQESFPDIFERRKGELVAYRQNRYAMFSGNTHGNPLALLVGVFAFAPNGRSSRVAVGGRYSLLIRRLAEDLSWATFEHMSLLLVTLHRRHAWGVPAQASAEEHAQAVWLLDKWRMLQSFHIARRRRHTGGRRSRKNARSATGSA
jgi:hypothetical protein